MNNNIFKYIGAAINEINSFSCMYYAYCNSSILYSGGYNSTSLCWQNVYSRSPSLVSQECSATDNLCYGYYYNYTNYLTNSLLGYYYQNVGCYYYPTNLTLTYGQDVYSMYDRVSFVHNLSSYVPGIKSPIQVGFKYFFCNTSNCNSKTAGACITAEYIQNIYSSNWYQNYTILTSLPVYQSCSSDSSGILPTFKLTITLSLKVNQVFISDYNNINSASSLSFIQNFTKFVNYY